MALTRQIEKCITDGDTTQALHYLAQAIEHTDSRAEALGHRAWVLRSLGKLDDALADYRTLLAETPRNVEVRARIAETLALMGRPSEAASAAIETLQCDSTNTIAISVLAILARASGHEVENTNPPAPIASTSTAQSVIELLESNVSAFPTSVMPEVGRLLHAWVRCIRPKIVIETGSFIGYSALWIAGAMEENGAGHLHSFDLFESRGDYISPVIGAPADSLEIARAHLERAALSHRVTFHKGDSSTNIAAYFRDKNLQADMAFIDGDHTVQGCAKDWNAIAPLLAPGATVFVHDTLVGDANHWLGPQALLKTLSTHDRSECQWVNLPTADRLGMAIIQKRGEKLFTWNPSLPDLARQWFFYRLLKK